MAKAQPIQKKSETKPHRIKILLTSAGVLIENPMPGVEIEIRDYDVPDDWVGSVGRDHEGDRFEFVLFDDKGEVVVDAAPPNEYEEDDPEESDDE